MVEQFQKGIDQEIVVVHEGHMAMQSTRGPGSRSRAACHCRIGRGIAKSQALPYRGQTEHRVH